MSTRRAFLVLAIGLVAGLPGGAGAADYPSRPIEIVVPYAPGGGTDIMVRQIVKVLEEQKLVTVPVTVNNRTGGSGVVGKSFAINKPPDGYTLVAVDAGNWQQELQGNATWSYRKDFTYLARMVTDVNLLIVRKESPLNSVQELLAAARAKGKGGLSIGGTNVGQVDHIANINLTKATKVDFTYVPFKSGGEVMTNLLGGHVDAAWANPNECIGQLEAGQVRALAVADEERLKGLPKIQTMKELGVAMVSNQWRALGGPGNLPKPVVDFWVNALDKVRKTDTWRKGFLEKSVLEDGWLTGEAFLQAVDREQEIDKAVFAELGLLKK
ncbi:MAG TPA: tripartite tricarboxylate transporter substrate binding protein [Methylomirabilota bacterium]|jgi:putative tricarboxylic transport membrane protein|nr:tripartite tricarboxylate transporter substrate binding protein [Methylomirabilota bacterium]